MVNRIAIRVMARIALGLASFALVGTAQAAVVDFSFGQLVVPPSAAMAGPGPWLDVQIADTATAGTVSVTVSAALTGSQTLTGIWLNLPGATGALSSFTLDPGVNGSGEDPFGFAALNAAAPTTSESAVDSVQNIHPTGTTKAQVGDYNVYLRFANNAGAAFQTNESETFNLVANPSSGLSASSFLSTSAQTAGGAPNPPFYALASFTNAGGLAGSGIAYVAALPAVPETDALALLLAGLVALHVRPRRKANAPRQRQA